MLLSNSQFNLTACDLLHKININFICLESFTTLYTLRISELSGFCPYTLSVQLAPSEK